MWYRFVSGEITLTSSELFVYQLQLISKRSGLFLLNYYSYLLFLFIIIIIISITIIYNSYYFYYYYYYELLLLLFIIIIVIIIIIVEEGTLGRVHCFILLSLF